MFKSSYNLTSMIIRNLKYRTQNSYIHPFSKIISSKIGFNVTVGLFSDICNSILEDYVRIYMLSQVINSSFGRHSYMGKNGFVTNTKIGAFTSIAWNVTIGAPEHKIDLVTTNDILSNSFHGFIKKEEDPLYTPSNDKVIVGNDVWIGANVVIKRNVKIGDGAVIGAGAVVTKDIPDYAIAVGVPARVIKYRFSKKTINALKKLKWWDWSDEIIKKNLKLFASNPEDPEVLKKLQDIKKRLDKG
ncbi:MAG: hypothetical protein PWR32_670 [Candidatus Woesearchaeota archaeon]|nr:hypothetical protein [Candidatus Woesearchaeota archaeon]